MRRNRVRHGLLALLVALVAVPAPAAAAEPAGTDPGPAPAVGPWAKGRVIVGYTSGATPGDRHRARATVGAERGEPLEGTPRFELVATRLPVAEAVARLRTTKGVRYAEPDHVVRASLTPNDPRLDEQWGFEQPNDIDIDAAAAWDTTTGSASTIVAVIDTGIQLDHPDLAANVWTNSGEVPGNGLDDDDNGYVDDVHGWDFVADDNAPSDANGHGTHVAGTIAAVGGNGIGVAGVAHGSTVMPLRMLDATGSGFVSDAVRAIGYAKANGARVANLSWTWRGGISQSLMDALEAAGDAGMVICAAAGNSAEDVDLTPEYPAAYDLPDLLSVAAVASNGTLSTFSNRGLAGIDLAAPGTGILSTWPGGGYETLDGTSMATPHVAGVAALLVSAHPAWTPREVRDRILATARPRAALAGVVGTGGILNAAAALAPGNQGPSVAITEPATGTMVQPGTRVRLAATAVDPEDGNVGASITWHSSLMGPLGTGPSLTRADLSMGTHLIVATARDAAGHRRSATITVRVSPPITLIDDHAEAYVSTMALAPDGTPIVSWTEYGKGTIVSRREGGGWSREVVSASWFDGWPDVLVDPEGTVHVAVDRKWKSYGAVSDGGIVVAGDDGTGAGTGWTIERVSEACGDDADGCGLDTYPSLAREPSGRLHVAWGRVPFANVPIDGNHPGLWHAVSHPGGNWTPELVLEADNVLNPDIEVDADGATHIVFWREPSGPQPGLYHATDASGDWVIEPIADLPADGFYGSARVAVGAAGRLDVAWGTEAGVVVRSQVGGAWQAPVNVTTNPTGRIDLVRAGASLHLVYEAGDANRIATGIGYAVDHGSGWTVEDLDVGQDVLPRLAVDAAGNPHVAYQRGFPEHELRHATNDGTGWTTEVVKRGSTWMEPLVGVDAAGHHHVVVGRYGAEPGTWYATDRTGSWALERLAPYPPSGKVGLAVAPDGTASIAYALDNDERNQPLADRGIWVKTGRSGAWSTHKVTSDNAGGGVTLARGTNGRLYLAYPDRLTAFPRIAWATNASGSWTTGYATPGAAGREESSPSIAVDGAGRMHIAYQESDPLTANSAVRYATNASGAWTRTLISAGSQPRIEPQIALDPAGQPRIAYWHASLPNLGSDDGIGIRVASRYGATWTTKVVSTHGDDVSPAIAVDGQGHTHLLYARMSGLDACAIPLCADAPGLRHWSDKPGFGGPRRVDDDPGDAEAAIVRGADGSIQGAFASPVRRLGVIDLQAPPPSVTTPAVHLVASGTAPAGQARLAIMLRGSHLDRFRLTQSVNGGSWTALGSVTSATTRSLNVPLSSSTTRRFRVTGYDGLGVAGNTMTGPTLRVFGRSESPGSGLAYRGSWATTRSASHWGGTARFAKASSASVTWTFTGREIAWTALRSPGQGDARVYLDGKLVATVRLKGKTAYRQVVFAKALGGGSHRITIRPAGNGRVTLDGFIAIR